MDKDDLKETMQQAWEHASDALCALQAIDDLLVEVEVEDDEAEHVRGALEYALSAVERVQGALDRWRRSAEPKGEPRSDMAAATAEERP